MDASARRDEPNFRAIADSATRTCSYLQVSVSVVRMAAGAASDTEAGIVSARRRAAGGYTIEFVSREKRDAVSRAHMQFNEPEPHAHAHAHCHTTYTYT